MITTSVLMCHAPIVIPEIGGVRSHQCQATTHAMTRAARHLVRSRPDVLVVLSPHAPRDVHAFGIARGPVRLDFHAFGSQLGVEFEAAEQAAALVQQVAAYRGVPCTSFVEPATDHGAAVPLHFVARAGFRGQVMIVSLPYPGARAEAEFGAVLAEAALRSEQRWAILASGDLSHRLLPQAPAGYHPRAKDFDLGFVEAIAAGDYRKACWPDRELQALAAEDAVVSTWVATSASSFDSRGHELYGYEGPFGVGYAAALLYDCDAPPSELAEVAALAVRAYLDGAPFVAPEWDAPWNTPRALFVTLRGPSDELRGCIGSLEPSESSLGRELARVAVLAATQDPRFPPLRREELATTYFEVSVLESPEPISQTAELDPSEYGVVASVGSRRGVLLPDVAGIDTPEMQVSIAKQKADIGLNEVCELQRFRVHKVKTGPPLVH